LKTQDKIIKVLIVDDSAIVHLLFKRMLSDVPEIKVVGTAFSGEEALELIPKLKPDVICTDFHMPGMNGLEFTKAVMVKFPRPILVISVSVEEGDDDHNIFRLLEAGAVDVFPKPDSVIQDFNREQFTADLIQKIKILSGVFVFHKHTTSLPDAIKAPKKVFAPQKQRPVRILVIGASTGGPPALDTILNMLPADFPVPIVCVQHISDGFAQGLVDWLGSQCKLNVKFAEKGEHPSPGTVYFPPEGIHLEFDAFGHFKFSRNNIVAGHCPSITVTFNSAAKYYGSSVAAVLLTGMGSDGAEGMRTVAQSGGLTIAQNEASSVVFGMPRVAIELEAAQHILALNEIPLLLNRLVQQLGSYSPSL